MAPGSHRRNRRTSLSVPVDRRDFQEGVRPPQLAASSIASWRRNVALWHFSEVAGLTDDVGSWGKSGLTADFDMPPKSGFLARENRSPVDQKCSITTLIRDAAKVLSSKLIGTRLLSRLTLAHGSRGPPRGTFRSSDSSPTGRRAAIRVACRV